jgi:hypothetical protein
MAPLESRRRDVSRCRRIYNTAVVPDCFCHRSFCGSFLHPTTRLPTWKEVKMQKKEKDTRRTIYVDQSGVVLTPREVTEIRSP